MTDSNTNPERARACPFCGKRPLVEDGRNDRPWIIQCVNTHCHAQPFMDHADTKREAIAAWNSNAASERPEREWPDIGVDPLKGPRADDRHEASAARLRAAYVKQQGIVPDQTALVWRYDLGSLLEIAVRFKALLERPERETGEVALRNAAQAMVDDHQTSETHHPDHILVPKHAFDRMVSALATPLPSGGDQSQEARVATDADLKDFATELLSHRGERPYRILRGGSALWETWLPAIRAAMPFMPRAALSVQSEEGHG